MDVAPLRYVERHMRPGLLELLGTGVVRLECGSAYSPTYPAAAKLAALGLTDRFDVVLTAQSPEVGVFKPHPRGLRIALERLGVPSHEALYVGDRPEVDAATAAAAGVPCVILGSRAAAGWRPGDRWIGIASCLELAARLDLATAPAVPGEAPQPSLHHR